MPREKKKQEKQSSPNEYKTSTEDFNAILNSLRDCMAAFENVVNEKNSKKRAEILDRINHANLGMMTTGLSPAAITVSFTDWWAHLMMAPNKRLQLAESAGKKAIDWYKKLWEYGASQDSSVFDTEDKRFHQRFKEEAWQKFPFSFWAQSFLSIEQWWREASKIRGVDANHEKLLSFILLQWLNAISPENYLFSNPVAVEKVMQTNGKSLIQGIINYLEDLTAYWKGDKSQVTHDYVVGRDIAVTKGKVVFRNDLMELIQYTPQTKTVYSEPVLIIPAWIMKYYILDLSPHNSMVDYLVKKGHTVFMISWKNPDARYRDYGMTDYMNKGVIAASDAVKSITNQSQMHAVGYCIGGTLLSMTTSYLTRQKDTRFKTISLFAAQTDFDEPGELMTFIDENQLCYLEDIMYSQGYLRGDQMSSTFDMLRPKELIWAKWVTRYLLGEELSVNDLVAWNKDTTRLPYKMHSEYLRYFHLCNDFVEGDYQINGEPVTLEDITIPLFAVGTEKDHIAPWKSVYKIHLYTRAPEITFVLANRGHNGGIVSEPGHKGRTYRLGKSAYDKPYLSPDDWVNQHKSREGSWWPAWHRWLASHSDERIAPPSMGAADKGYPVLIDAPGRYVKEQ